MYIFLVILRLVHILAGTFWVGAALMMTFFISPTVNATQDSGRSFSYRAGESLTERSVCPFATLTATRLRH